MIPPEKFKEAGLVDSAKLVLAGPAFARRKKYTGRRAAGIRYEYKAQAHLQFLFPDTYVPGPWIYFHERGAEKYRWCQPDGLNFDVPRGIITCVEIKYTHTSDAWFQTRKLYFPVLRKLFPSDLWELQVCEVCKWYDPSVQFPEPVQLSADIAHPTSKFKVHIWRP